MSPDEKIVNAVNEVRLSYGEDAAQDLAVLMLERERAGRLYHDNLKFWAKQRAHRNVRDRLRKESHEVSTDEIGEIADSPANQEASVLLTEVLQTRQGKAIYRHITGEKPIRTRQYLHQLRQELKEKL